MNTDTDNTLNMRDIFGLWSRYRTMILALTCASLALFAAMAVLLPKRYKSSFVLAINSSYFQNPLTRDLTPDIYDSAEMRSQRESLIRQSLSPAFLDFIGEKYGIYQSGSNGILQKLFATIGYKPDLDQAMQTIRSSSEKRQELMSRISVLNLNNDTFRISFIYSNPDIAFHVTQDIYMQMAHGLGEIRRNNLVSLRDAIHKRLDALASSLPKETKQEPSETFAGPVPPPGSGQTAYSDTRTAENELLDVRRQLRMMTVRYTEDHPLVRELREREKSLSAMLGPSSDISGRIESPLAVQVPTDAVVEIYKDLNRKLNYLNISLESNQAADVAALESPLYPTDPLWPPRGLFILWGLAAGFIGGFFLAAIREYFDRAALHASDLSQELGVPFIGTLPELKELSWSGHFPPN